MGSVPSMQGEISHWWPPTDGGLTARCNTDPREYQVSPHYTLHRLFQLPMLPFSDWNNRGNSKTTTTKKKTLLLQNPNFKTKLLIRFFCRSISSLFGCASIAASTFFNKSQSLYLNAFSGLLSLQGSSKSTPK